MKRRHSERYQLILNLIREDEEEQHLSNNFSKSGDVNKDKIINFIETKFSEIIIRKNVCLGLSKILTIDLPNHLLARFSEEFNSNITCIGVSSWALAQSTLRDIFLDCASSNS